MPMSVATVIVHVKMRMVRVIVAVVVMSVRMPVNSRIAIAAAANLAHDRPFSCYRWCAIDFI
jgi:hypothetical protein